jgi:hypothetical protein
MKILKQRLILSVFIVLSLFVLVGNGWSQQVGRPHALFEGFMATYLHGSDYGLPYDLQFFDTVITGVVLNDGSTPGNDPIIWSTVEITTTRNPVGVPGTSFNNATITITDGITTYLSATLTNINFIAYGSQWYLNPDLDINHPETLNLTNILLNPNGSAYIQELATALGSNTIAGMQITLDVFDGDITGDSNSFIQGLFDGVPAVVPNAPPVADAGATTSNTTCLATTCQITLNGSQSTDPDGTSDIVSYKWFRNNVQIATGATVNVSLPLGTHDITLKVTDSAGNTDEATITVVIDPAELSFIDVDKARLKNNGLVDIKGRIALPAGISYLGINSVGHATIGISSLGNVIDQSVDFTELNNKSKWKYDANPLYGIEDFKIDWSGAKFNYEAPLYNLKMKTLIIGASETSLQIQSCAAVTIVINGVTVNIDRSNIDRNKRATCSHASAKFDRDNDGEDDDRDDDQGDSDDDDGKCTTNIKLPFALTPDMTITIIHGTTTESISVADYYKAAVGKFTLTGRFNPNGINFNLVPNLTLTVALGDQGFSGTVVIDNSTWTRKQSKQCDYDRD